MLNSKIDFQEPLDPFGCPILSLAGRIDTGTCQVPAALHLVESNSVAPPLTNAELVQLQIRVIALEQLVTVLLSGASVRQREMVVEFASSIFPRAGFTPHGLTIHAAAQMIHLSRRASLFEAEPPNDPTRSQTQTQGCAELADGAAGTIAR